MGQKTWNEIKLAAFMRCCKEEHDFYASRAKDLPREEAIPLYTLADHWWKEFEAIRSEQILTTLASPAPRPWGAP